MAISNTGIPGGAKISLANSIFGGLGHRMAKDNYDLQSDLLKAHTPMLPATYIANCALNTLIVTFLSIIIGLGVALAAIPMMNGMQKGTQTDESGEPITWEIQPWVQYVILLLTCLIIPFLTWKISLKLPSWKIKTVAPKIDRALPYASSFVAAMAAANATPEKIFKALASPDSKRIYGPISDEAALVYRDVNYLGKDMVSSLKMAVERAPSEKLAEFMQGIVGTMTSGGNLKLYFLNRAEYYSQENRVRVRRVIETLALFAESYVVSAVAMPIFIMIIMVITLWVSGSGFSMDKPMMNMIVFGMLPMMQGGFAALFYLYSQDVA